MAGCDSLEKPPASASRPVWLIGNGFHTSIVMRARDTPPAWRALHGCPRADYLLVGWGNRTFYTGGKTNVFSLARASLLPDRSVLHVMPIRGPITRTFAHADLVRFDVNAARHAEMCAFIDHSFARDARGGALYMKPGFYAGSRFYQGRATFLFPNICTTWCGRGLQKAGVPIFLLTALTGENLMCQAERFGVLEQRKHAPVDGF